MNNLILANSILNLFDLAESKNIEIDLGYHPGNDRFRIILRHRGQQISYAICRRQLERMANRNVWLEQLLNSMLEALDHIENTETQLNKEND